MSNVLQICELFKSIQGESTFAGRICTFVRLAECNLHCSYCDTGYARTDGTPMTFAELFERINDLGCSLVEITGGEPLLQRNTAAFAEGLLSRGNTVLVETNGSLDIGMLPDRCVRIVDVKCPSSGEGGSFLERNITLLRPTDELKFVIGSREDFDWATAFLAAQTLPVGLPVHFSPVAGSLPAPELARWIVESNAPARLQLQLHKIIWGDRRGV
jgi:7-carboxy-7-deazaguanine synthase